MEKKIPFTQEAYDQLVKDLNNLKNVERPRVLQELVDARAQGDLSENAEYHAAKERLAAIDNVELPKLQDQLEEQKCFAADLEKDVRALRKLVRDMWPHVRHRSRMCGECELPCDTSDECLLYEPMRQRMRELGIEVNG